MAFAGTITTNFYITKSNGPQLKLDAYVYDYDPTAGTKTLIGQTASPFVSSGSGTNVLYTFTVPANGTLLKNHRLLWKFDAYSNNSTTFNFLFDGISSRSEASYCVTPPANLVLDKQVDSFSIQPGGTQQYTIKFANTGQTNATGAQIVDTLPSGVTFNSATLNGTSVTPAAVSGQQYTFNLHSTDTATVGRVTGGQSGVLVINVTVDQLLAVGIASLLNSASLLSNETSAVTDTAATTVLRPAVTVSKSADKSLLIPGDIVTYAISVLNSGAATATNVTVADTLPATAYFTYVAGSTKLNGTTAAPDPVTGNALNINIGSLTTGASATVTFQMQVAAMSVPDGVTTLSNTALVSDAQTSGSRSSDPVVLSISTNPNLRLIKTTSPAPGPVQAGGAVVYTLTLSNIGSSDALDVLVQDPIPANSHLVANTLVDNGTPQTDIADGDIAHFDAVGNRAVYRVGTLPSGVTRTLQFTIRVDSPLPSGTTTINNLATVSASNSASKQGSAAIDAMAAPNLTLTKSGPSMRPYPLTTLASSASATTSISVASVAFLTVGDVISVNGTTVAITAISNNQLTLSAPVTGAAGAQVIPTYEYVLSFANTGNADATFVVVQDSLPAGLTFISADNSGTFGVGIVTWSLGTIAAGQTGSLRVRVRPNGTGSFVNSATIDSNDTLPSSSNNVTTNVGGLTLTKSTTTAVVSNSSTGTQASYIIALYNQLSTAATGVQVTDLLPAGFSYASTTTVGGNATRTSTQNPTSGDTQPVWGTWSIPANGDLSITFVANIASTVGAATYQNGVSATSTNTGVVPFDELGTTAEDVTVFFGAVAGNVFSDTNGNGTKDASENDLSGVTVTVVDSLGVSHTTTTDPSGNYSISNLPTGSATVTATAPSGMVLTTSNSPQSVTITILSGSVAATAIGFQARGGINGHLFVDSNGDGDQDAGEPDLANIDVVVTDAFGGTYTISSGVTGDYSFTSIPAGSASVNVNESDPQFPTGATQTAGSDPTTVTVAGGTFVSAGIDGYQQRGSVTGHVFEDANGNGIQDAAEIDLNGLAVTVTDAFGGTYPATTDPSGNYAVSDVPIGSVGVTVATPAGTALTTANNPQTVTVAAVVSTATTPVGFQGRGSVAGTVFNDANGNGTMEIGETGLGGVTVTVISSGVTRTVTTAADGSYTASDVPVGTATVDVVNASLPAGSVQTAGVDPSTIAVSAGGTADAGIDGYQQQADLSVTQTTSTTTPALGQNVTFSIVVTNNGPSDATGIAVEDFLPAGLTLVSSSATNGSYASGIWIVGTLANGASEMLTIVATVTSSGTIVNTAEVSAANQFDPDSTPANGIAGEDDQDSVTLGPNIPPVAQNYTETAIANNTTVHLAPLQANDTDGTIADYTIITLPSATAGVLYLGDPNTGGTAVTVNQTLTAAQVADLYFKPAITFIGNASFTFTATDNQSAAATPATIAIPVTSAPPTAVDDSATVPEDGSVVISVRNNDTDPNSDPLIIVSVTSPAHGTVVVNADGTVTYTPDPNYNGPDTFSYTISDGNGQTDSATVTISVLTVNDPPVAVNDSVTTPEDTAVTISVLLNDSDIDGDKLSVTATSTPAHGTIVVNADGTITYTPDQNYTGADSFTYTISDGQGGTATTTVFIGVGGANDAPDAVNDGASTPEDTAVTVTVLANDSDPDNDPLIVTTTSTPAHGTVVVNGDGTITYTPAANYSGPDSFTYTIADGQGGTDTATVAITVTPVNDPPVAVDNSATTSVGTPVSISVLTNDNDIDGDTLSVTGASTPAHGTATVNADGTITYTPAAGFAGSDTFTYDISDGHGGTATATVTVIVNEPPVAEDKTQASIESGAVAAVPILHATDDGAVVNYTIVTIPAATQGVLYLGDPNSGGIPVSAGQVLIPSEAANLYFQADLNFVGNASFTYTATDNMGVSDPTPATVIIPVSGPTAVTLSIFTATRQNGAIAVAWTTTSEVNTFGFHVYRSADGLRAHAVRITPQMVLANGRGSNGASYNWTDITAQFGAHYTYWLVETEIGGATNWYGPTTPLISPAGWRTRVWIPLIVL